MTIWKHTIVKQALPVTLDNNEVTMTISITFPQHLPNQSLTDY